METYHRQRSFSVGFRFVPGATAPGQGDAVIAQLAAGNFAGIKTAALFARKFLGSGGIHVMGRASSPPFWVPDAAVSSVG